MKKAVCVLFAMLMTSGFVSAAQSNPACYSKANEAVEQFVDRIDYDANGFETYECFLASNQKAVICEVSASKGDGAAIDTYRVVLNRNCTKIFRVELIGEE